MGSQEELFLFAISVLVLGVAGFGLIGLWQRNDLSRIEKRYKTALVLSFVSLFFYYLNRELISMQLPEWIQTTLLTGALTALLFVVYWQLKRR